jgi:hypothetical protein
MDHRLAGGRQPLFPFTRALRRPVSVEQQFPAQRAPAVLGLQETQAGDVHRPGYAPVPPGGPVTSQGGVVGRRGSPDHLVPDDFRPGEPEQVGAAVAVAEDPLVLPGLAERAEVAAGDPPGRLVRVAMAGPLVGELPQVVVQRGEGLAGYRRPVVGGPAPGDGVEPGDDRRALAPRRDRSSVRSRSRIRLIAALLGLISSLPW